MTKNPERQNNIWTEHKIPKSTKRIEVEKYTKLTISEFAELQDYKQIIRAYNSDLLRHHSNSWQELFCESIRLGKVEILDQIGGISEDTFGWLIYNWAVVHFAIDHQKTVEKTRANGVEYTDVLFYHKTAGGCVTKSLQENQDWKARYLAQCSIYMPNGNTIYDLI